MTPARLAWLNELQTYAELLVIACRQAKGGADSGAIELCARNIAEQVLPQDLKYATNRHPYREG